MATLSSGLRVPPEIFYLVLAKCDKTEDLSSASLVSWNWYHLAFHELHKCIFVRTLSQLESLTSRLESVEHKTRLRIGACLRALEIDFDESEVPFDSKLNRSLAFRFQQTIPKLENLERLEWGDSTMKTGLFQSFRDSCPKLQAVTLSRCGDDVTDTLNREIFQFRNLKHLGLMWGPLVSNTPSRIHESMLDVVENSPDLERLELELTSMDWDEDVVDEWAPSEFFHHLRNPLKKLRHIKIGGSPSVDWKDFTKREHPSCPMRTFFEAHPLLQSIHFDWDHQYEPGIVFEPAMVHRVFPSLVHFTGPITMCTAVVASPLAKQLRSLEVLFEHCDGSYSESTKATRALLEAMKHLPALKELDFAYHGCVDPRRESRLLNEHDLEIMLKATPVLTTLSLPFFHIDLNDLLKPLRHTPLLDKLIVRNMGPHTLERVLLTRNTTLSLMGVCSRLQYVRLMNRKLVMRSPAVVRLFDGSVAIRMDC